MPTFWIRKNWNHSKPIWKARNKWDMNTMKMNVNLKRDHTNRIPKVWLPERGMMRESQERGWYLAPLCAHLQHFLCCELVIMEVYLRAGRQGVHLRSLLGCLPLAEPHYVHGCMTAWRNQSNAQSSTGWPQGELRCRIRVVLESIVRVHQTTFTFLLTNGGGIWPQKPILGWFLDFSSCTYDMFVREGWRNGTVSKIGTWVLHPTGSPFILDFTQKALPCWKFGSMDTLLTRFLDTFNTGKRQATLLAPTCALRLNNMNDLGDMQVDGEYKVIFYHTYLIFKVWGPATVNKPKLNDWDSGKSENIKTSSTLCQHIHEHLGLRWYTDIW